MGFGVDPVPVPAGSGIALFGTWRVASPERQDAVVKAIAAAWQARPWPGAGLRSYAVLAGDDGDTLLHFSQADGEGVRPDPGWKQDVDAAVPGIERAGVVAARLQHSTPMYGAPDAAGCVVLVTRVFDGPDVGRAEGLVEAMFEGSSGTAPADGLISAHFFVGLDGARVFNYALWASAAAHENAIGNRPAKAQLEANPQWRKAHAWPGLVSTTFQRFRPRLHLAPS